MHARRIALVLLAAALLLPQMAVAHPMGNFSVNHYSKIDLLNDRIEIRYFIDLAEIPAFQELQQGGIKADVNDSAVTRFVAVRGEELGRGLELTLDGARLDLRMVSSGVIFPPGAGGLPTMKVGFVYEAPIPAGLDRTRINLHYADSNYPGHSGWKEIVAGSALAGIRKNTAPTTDRSAELSHYPTDLLNSPPQDLEASIEFALPALVGSAATEKTKTLLAAEQKAPVVKTGIAPAIHAAAIGVKPHINATATHPPQSGSEPAQASLSQPIQLSANRQQTPRNKFTELISAQSLSFWFLLTAAIIAIGLGALHALEPGHGKTIVAAYLVGSRGTARHAFLLGLIVTVSHTAGVFALGAITLYASRYIVPERLYPWLGALSGITIAALGGYMLLRRLTGMASDHSHAPGSNQAHWNPFNRRANSQDEAPLEIAPVKRVSLAQLFTLGITGGIIPCPAALVVLLSAFALHRIALGFFLIVAFSVGLAAVLIAFGMAMVYAGRVVARFKIDGPLTRRWLPAASSAFIALLGVALAIQSLAPLHLSLASVSREKLGPFLFVVGLGLVLGMRHSTDADHVVAMSTIVTKQRGMRNAALIGSVWGLGHTITIVIVGALIILFGVEIPPRVGLSMEFSVAMMLVLLGILNLTGVLKKITARFTPKLPVMTAAEDADQSQSQNASGGMMAGSVAQLGMFQLVRPLVIGLVHGLAGSAAVALLVLSTIHDPLWATAYLVVFGGGTVVGMMLMTTAISVPLAVAGGALMGIAVAVAELLIPK